jgi:hypothetical protein
VEAALPDVLMALARASVELSFPGVPRAIHEELTRPAGAAGLTRTLRALTELSKINGSARF